MAEPVAGFGGDVISELVKFIGPPNNMKNLHIDGAGGNPQITGNFPEAFIGKSRWMEQLIEARLVGNTEWYTKELLPLEKSDNPNIMFTTLEFNRSFFELEPFGGNPNYLTYSKNAFNDKMLQRGMAFEIAHEFWKTEDGRKQYVLNLQALDSCAILTICNSIILAVLFSRNFYHNKFLKTPNNHINNIVAALRHKKRHFAVLNKGMAEFRRFHAEIEELLAGFGVKPTIWALPPRSKILMTHADSTDTDYYMAGKLAIANRIQGQDAVDTIRGVKVHETNVLQEEITKQTTGNPLARKVEYGSFHFITNFFRGCYLDTYKSDERFSAKIMDASKDGLETQVTGRSLIRLSGRFNSDGTLSYAHRDLISDARLHEMNKRLGNAPNNKNIDMFIGYDSLKQLSGNSEGLYVMDYFGEIRDLDVSNSDLRDFAKTCANRLSPKLSEEERKAIQNACEFMDKLNNIPLDEESRAYWVAVALSGTIPKGENTPVEGSLLFKDNGMGCIRPPYVGSGGLSIVADSTVSKLAFSDSGYVLFVDEIPDTALSSAFDSTGRASINVNGSATTFSIKKTVYAPMGFGTPTGLRTLSSMYHSGEHRGYSLDILKEADIHYQTLIKFHNVWKTLFPGHELGNASACPYYFRDMIDSDDELTAFGLNLYHHAQYPVFAVKPSLQDGFLYDFSVPDPAEIVSGPKLVTGSVAQQMITDNKLPPDKSNISEGLTALDDATFTAKLTATLDLLTDPLALDVFSVTTSNQSKMLSNILRVYRSKPYKSLSLASFLARIVVGAKDERVAAAQLTAVIQILNANSSNSIIWDEELKKASTSQTPTLAGRTANNTPTKQKETKKTALNTRICVGRSSFIRLVDSIQFASGAVPDFLRMLPIRPMNILNPSVPLGLDLSKPDEVLQLKAAASPASKNTVSALSNSKLMQVHLSAPGTSSGTTGQKRTRTAAPVVSSATSGASRRRRIAGGVLSVSSVSADDVFGPDVVLDAIPQGMARYGTFASGDSIEEEDYDPGTIPMNVLQDASSHIFIFDKPNSEQSSSYRTALIKRFHEFATKELDPLVRIFAQSWTTTRINACALENWYDMDCLMLVSFTLWRSRQRYIMGTGFLAEGGGALGRTFHGFHDWQWADDVVKKTHIGHYTFQMAASVRDPKRVFLAENMVAMGYVCGEDVTFITSPQDVGIFLSDPDAKVGSIIVKMIPYNTNSKQGPTSSVLPCSPQDIGGRWNTATLAELSPEIPSTENYLHGDSAYFYDFIYKLDAINRSVSISQDGAYRINSSVVNTTCWLGHHRLFNPASKAWDTLILDDGPFGDDIYKGVITDRDITGHPIRKQQYQNAGVNIFS